MQPLPLIVNHEHAIHHIKDKGYVEAPVRIPSILNALNKTALFQEHPTRTFSDKWIEKVHAKEYLRYFKNVLTTLKPEELLYPYIFPVRNQHKPPKALDVSAGYYCIDTFTPISHNAYTTARQAVNCTLTAAEALLKRNHFAYSLVRPPGHHAERKYFGGFCYFNNSAIAAEYLSRHGSVAILDIDYHHGNGQQDIFYERDDVLTISLHGHPDFAYPYFAGFAEETGNEKGKGYNINYPLPETISRQHYHQTLKKAINKIQEYNPTYIVVPFGLDTAQKDPTGTWNLQAPDFYTNGTLISTLNKPTLIVQEGGYYTNTMGENATAFFQGLTNNP